ncbi:unnamed protein product, partial [Ectocarpus sp. 12 AP-2014]
MRDDNSVCVWHILCTDACVCATSTRFTDQTKSENPVMTQHRTHDRRRSCAQSNKFNIEFSRKVRRSSPYTQVGFRYRHGITNLTDCARLKAHQHTENNQERATP